MSALTSIDVALRSWAITHRSSGLNGVMLALSAVGQGGLIWLAIAAVLAGMRRISVRDAIVTALSIGLAAVLADYILKPIVNRPRPFVSTPSVVIGSRPTDASFPSGHAANAGAGAFSLVQAAPAGALVWWTLAAAIAYSRIYLGVHYPFDVVAGAAVGVASAWLVRAVMKSARA